MNKRFLMVLLSFLPILAFADDGGSNITFAPPASDYSVVFLGNLFGTVDGVLHSSGSQIMGAMFTVFNSAVLALGGIIIMYTLMVSTMNTAHEGQMLGQKWSSIWIPVRSTLGLALLIPKTSGYCLMQIFVMWVVVQGVGAADKVWQAALSYMNTGGVIIQAQPNPGLSLLGQVNGKALAIPKGAYTMLLGQVCMLGIQKQLEAQRKADTGPGGRCKNLGLPDSVQKMCKTSVPDFLSTVNFVSLQSKPNSAAFQSNGNYVMYMPYFGLDDPKSPYIVLDGTCGTITWAPVSGLPSGPAAGQTTVSAGKTADNVNILGFDAAISNGNNNAVTLSTSELDTAKLARAIALQQMYTDLSLVAQTMVDNNPSINPSTNGNNTAATKNNCSLLATQGFGIPYNSSGGTCSQSSPSNQTCTSWGPDPTLNCSGALFNGTEFAGAVTDYNGVMQPTLRLINTLQSTTVGDNARSFIAQANSQGWMMAGAYFFDLVKLNGSSIQGKDGTGLTDENSGLDNSTATKADVGKTPGDEVINHLNNSVLSTLLNNDPSKIAVIAELIQGVNGEANAPSFTNAQQTFNSLTGSKGLTVNGFVNNSLMVIPAGQPGAYATMKFANVLNVNVSPQNQYLKPISFGCGKVTTFIFSFCLGGLIGDLVYNVLIMPLFDVFMFFLGQIIQQLVMAFLMIPLQAMAQIFQAGLAMINQPGANPIVALATMGNYYINFAGNLWLQILFLLIAIAPLAPIALPVLMLIAPLFFSWIGVMVSIGFTTAYYLPILPYMIFTFGSIAWLIAVIEAMVAAPIVALGVTHPEGHDAFGKGEAAIMLLMNVFLRPAMMIIGYISAIALSYVSVWVLNAGFDQAISFVQAPQEKMGGMQALSNLVPGVSLNNAIPGMQNGNGLGGNAAEGSGSGGYSDWAGIFAFFFAILIYTTMYLTLVQKAFTLISYLPDKVLRWIGGSPESLGSESAQWGDEMVKGKSGEAAKGAQDAQGQINKQMGGHAQKQIGKLRGKMNEAMSQGDVKAGGIPKG